jgi:hypothetical protein
VFVTFNDAGAGQGMPENLLRVGLARPLGRRPLVHLSRLPARAEDSPSDLAGRRARAAAVVEDGRSRPAHPYALNSPCAAGAWHGRGLLC